LAKRSAPILGPRSNARPKDPTSATRSRRYRNNRRDGRKTANRSNRDDKSAPGGEAPQSEKQNEIKPGVTVDAPPLVPDTVVHVRHSRGITFFTLAAALALATVSAYFSITGLTSIFVGAFGSVIGMGIALEIGKLSAVAWLGHQRGTASRPLRAALAFLVTVLMVLNAAGCYGFLAKAHIGHQVEGETAVAGRAADIEARLSVQAAVVADLDRRIAQIDKAVETATSKGRTGSAMALADQQRKTRAELVAQRTNEAKTLAGLQVEKASIEGQAKVAEADLGPVRYLATLLGAGDQDVLRWFILVVALLLDPAAVLLLLAATRR
jgi:hypothetical protein